MKSIRALLLSLATVLLITQAAHAREVFLQHQGLTLNAALDMTEGKSLQNGIILITHGALAHRDMEMLKYLRKLLKESGHNTLAINLSLGINNRHGMYDCSHPHRHRNDDAITEIVLWVRWLKKQGAKEITLLGHSRGGAQTALYASKHRHPAIKSLILMAPATQENTDANAYWKRYNKTLQPILHKAQVLVRTKKGSRILKQANLMTCRNTPVSAESFVSYYGQKQLLDTPLLLNRVTQSTLVLVAGADKIVTQLDQKIATRTNNKKLQVKIIDGADHLFRDLNTDDAVDAINEFIEQSAES